MFFLVSLFPFYKKDFNFITIYYYYYLILPFSQINDASFKHLILKKTFLNLICLITLTKLSVNINLRVLYIYQFYHMNFFKHGFC